MFLKTKTLINRINIRNNQKGGALLGVAIAATVIGVVAIPFTRWFMSLDQNIDTTEARLNRISDRLEMQSIIQDYWNQINQSSYDEFEETITKKGTKWTEDIGGKYSLALSFGPKGKYENALCNEGATVQNDDRHCRKVKITIEAKDDSSIKEDLTTTRIASETSSSGSGFNTIETIEASTVFTAPTAGWYEFSVKGAGGGASYGYTYTSCSELPGGGGEGGITIEYAKLKKNQQVTIQIGNGGASYTGYGGDGGNTIVQIGEREIIGYGGKGGGGPVGFGGEGGRGTIAGAAGGTGYEDYAAPGNGAVGGGNGGGRNAVQGGGGTGGYASYGSSYYHGAGYKGENGVVWIKYYDPQKK